jgi:hypothetical protein
MNKSKHIYKHAVEAGFFSIITHDNDVEKVDIDGKPSIFLKESDTSEVWYSYDDVEYRDHDFSVIEKFKKKLQNDS